MKKTPRYFSFRAFVVLLALLFSMSSVRGVTYPRATYAVLAGFYLMGATARYLQVAFTDTLYARLLAPSPAHAPSESLRALSSGDKHRLKMAQILLHTYTRPSVQEFMIMHGLPAEYTALVWQAYELGWRTPLYIDAAIWVSEMITDIAPILYATVPVLGNVLSYAAYDLFSTLSFLYNQAQSPYRYMLDNPLARSLGTVSYDTGSYYTGTHTSSYNSPELREIAAQQRDLTDLVVHLLGNSMSLGIELSAIIVGLLILYAPSYTKARSEELLHDLKDDIVTLIARVTGDTVPVSNALGTSTERQGQTSLFSELFSETPIALDKMFSEYIDLTLVELLREYFVRSMEKSHVVRKAYEAHNKLFEAIPNRLEAKDIREALTATEKAGKYIPKTPVSRVLERIIFGPRAPRG